MELQEFINYAELELEIAKTHNLDHAELLDIDLEKREVLQVIIKRVPLSG